jgi:hypothetical protein
MKTSPVICLLIIILSLMPRTLHSQDSIVYPKLYFHTDREVYFPGDSIWFKAYYLDGQTQIFVPGDFSLYTDLLDDQGQTIDSQVLLLQYGQSAGKIEIPDSISPGNYLLRAFTDSQRNLGENAFFYKKLKVTSVESYNFKASSQLANQPPEIDVDFLPEGGILLAGQMNNVGVKALDDKGVGISLKGEILDSRGEVVSLFDTEYKGMGAFHFSPIQGKQYHAKIAGKPDFNYSFDDIVKEGIKIEYTGESKDELLFKITTNSEILQGGSYYFAILHKGRILFHQKFVQKGQDFLLKVKRDALSPGINRFVLLDEQLKPISERLYFSNTVEINDIQVVVDQESYGPRSKVQLELYNEDELEEMAISNLSVAVVDAYALGVNGPKQNILSWLLINSELRGSIESPAHFFKDDDYLTSKEKLNLLMLTNGWSRYIWTNLAENPPSEEFELTGGISLEGTVKHALTEKPIAKGDVELKIYSEDGFVSAEGKTDTEGRFSFDDIVFTDTAAVFIQGRNKKGKLYTVVDIDPIFKHNPKLPEQYFPKNETRLGYSSQLYEQKYYSDLDLKNFVLENGSILLEEVSITKKRETGDGHLRMYAKPYNSLKITNKDYGYRNVGDYLQGRVPGVIVTGDKILMRGLGSFRSGSPLFLLDGTKMPGDVIMNIPMADIDLVEVLKNPGEVGIFGVEAGNGVISVLTKRGGAPNWNDKYVQGTISRKLEGYTSFKEFYSPKYTPENIGSERPDHRLTLYWNPYVYLDNGKAVLSFFTSDDIAKYKVFVEGITGKGRICLGIMDLVVSQNDNLGALGD